MNQLYFKVLTLPGPREFSGRFEIHVSSIPEELEVEKPDCLSVGIDFGVDRTQREATIILEERRSLLLKTYRAIEIYNQ